VARLQSFPDWFVFCGSMSHSYKLVGNAVPPVLAWHLARNIELFMDRVFEEFGDNSVSVWRGRDVCVRCVIRSDCHF